MQPLLIATTNRDKLREIVSILAGAPFKIVTLADLPPVPPPEETGRTFSENARLKARYYSRITGDLTVAEDSGLAIDALDGAPGVESARLGGADATYPEKFALIYDALRQKNNPGSPARFVCAVALVRGGTVVYETEGVIEGSVADTPAGTDGFGYDPIFYYPPFGCTLAEAGARKSTVSHRGQAFRALRDFLTSRRLEP